MIGRLTEMTGIIGESDFDHKEVHLSSSLLMGSVAGKDVYILEVRYGCGS